MDLFGTAGIRGSVETDVTPELAVAVGRAVGREADEVVVGRDGRTTGPGLAAAVEAGALSGGAAVRRVGVVPTPALAFASRGRRGVMLTASHNPPGDNGIKLFVDGVEYDRAAERDVERRVEADEGPVPWDGWGDRRTSSPLPDYCAAVAEYARAFGAPLDGLRVVVDCGNGMGARATPAVLRKLGASVVSLHANVDGHFPGRGSKPTPDSLADLRGFVADDPDAALGIGHDGDADRIVIVDGDGEVVHEDTVLAVIAERYVRASDAADPVVVTTPNASGRIDERIGAAGGRVERVALGSLHEGVADVRASGETVAFAAEPWKHLHPRFGGWIDGVASAAVIARFVAAEGLPTLRAPVTERPYRKVSVPCPDGAKAGAMERLRTALPEAFPGASVDTDHGVRLDRPDGSWLLVRPSGTEPYVRLYAESETVENLVAEARAVVESAVERAS
ncbi:phosphomannomutase [Haloplanus rallus]|uniref:Phosphomannomutase n=1 Tax=Haloplanus rallus TaxID=1816183 RepID=A0A6B9FGW4_9EURY|nr:phosphomannomutase [Haloplanus rallus]QGX96509.1 phosphomannomutase [Haloplanus rallus]